jgi:hypothetical protein
LWDFARTVPNYEHFVSTNSQLSFNEMVSGPRSLPQNFRFLARRPPPTEIRSNVGLLRRKAEHLVLAGPFGWHAALENIKGICRERLGTWRDGAVV